MNRILPAAIVGVLVAAAVYAQPAPVTNYPPSGAGTVAGGTCSSHQFASSVGTNGAPGCAQPAITDVSGSVDLASKVTGTLPCANGGTAGTASAWTDYTPALTISSGSLTSASADGHWVQVCKTLFVSASVVITTNGTATGFLAFGLPNSLVSQSTFGQTMACRNDTTGVFLNGKLASSGTRVFIWGSGNAYPGADGVTLLCTGTVEVQ